MRLNKQEDDSMNKLNHDTIKELIELYEQEIRQYEMERLKAVDEFMKVIPDDAEIPDDLDLLLSIYVDMQLAKKGLFESRIKFLKSSVRRLYRENRAAMGLEITYSVSKDEAKQVPIEQVCERLGIEIKRNFARCPLHEERTPSFKIYPDNHFFCFGCGAGGDSIELVMKTQGLSFPKALKFILS